MPLEAESGNHEKREQSSASSAQDRNGSVAASELHCPRCGGLARRTWTNVFVLDLAIFLIFGALALPMLRFFLSLGSVFGAVLILAWIAIVLISLFALPVTGAAAVATRPRCGTCGHRFWAVPAVGDGAAEANFPVRFAVVGSGVLLLMLGIGLAWIAAIPGRETWTVTIVMGSRIIMAVLALGAGLLAQAGLWRILRTRKVDAVRQGFVLVLPAVILGTLWLALTAHDRSALNRKYHPLVRAPRVLAWAQLAELPPSAREVAVQFWAFLLSGKCYLRFAAEPNDIERFLADSPTLKGLVCQRYSRERMRIKSGGYPAGFVGPHDRHEHFYSTDKAPPWYEDEIRGAGRRYEINAAAGNWRGELIVDDERHVVYIHLDRY